MSTQLRRQSRRTGGPNRPRISTGPSTPRDADGRSQRPSTQSYPVSGTQSDGGRGRAGSDSLRMSRWRSPSRTDRKSVVEGKRVDVGGRRKHKKKGNRGE